MRGIGGGTRTIVGIILHGGEVCQWGRTKERGECYSSLQLCAMCKWLGRLAGNAKVRSRERSVVGSRKQE